jgi:hypothetical protein
MGSSEDIPMKRLFLSLAVLTATCFTIAPCLAYGQSQSQPALSQTAPAQPPSATAQAPARVWTNDDVDALRKNNAISVVGDNKGANNSSTSSKPNSYEKDPAWYRKQLVPLRADIEKLDAQIAKTKAFISGENVGDPPHYPLGLPGNPRDQIVQMEKKRQEDTKKIDDLLDRARHNEIPPGELR